LGEPIDLHQNAPEWDAMTPGARELVAHQVQDLGLREQRGAQETIAAIGATARPSGTALAKTGSGHALGVARLSVAAGNLAPTHARHHRQGGAKAAQKKIRASAGQN
jgi:hypothetical protein